MLLIVALTSSSLILCSSWLNNPPPPYHFLDFYYIIIYIILFLLLKPTFLKQSMKMTDVLKNGLKAVVFFSFTTPTRNYCGHHRHYLWCTTRFNFRSSFIFCLQVTWSNVKHHISLLHQCSPLQSQASPTAHQVNTNRKREREKLEVSIISLFNSILSTWLANC